MITDQEYCWQDLELAAIENGGTIKPHSTRDTKDSNGFCAVCGIEGLEPLIKVGGKVWLYYNKCEDCQYNWRLATEHYA